MKSANPKPAAPTPAWTGTTESRCPTGALLGELLAWIKSGCLMPEDRDRQPVQAQAAGGAEGTVAR